MALFAIKTPYSLLFSVCGNGSRNLKDQVCYPLGISGIHDVLCGRVEAGNRHDEVWQPALLDSFRCLLDVRVKESFARLLCSPQKLPFLTPPFSSHDGSHLSVPFLTDSEVNLLQRES